MKLNKTHTQVLFLVSEFEKILIEIFQRKWIFFFVLIMIILMHIIIVDRKKIWTMCRVLTSKKLLLLQFGQIVVMAEIWPIHEKKKIAHIHIL